MGKVVILLALTLSLSALPLASAAPTCSPLGVARACVDTAAPSVTYDNILVPLPAGGQVPRTHVSASPSEVNATTERDGLRASLDATPAGARACAIVILSGGSIINLDCTDTQDPPQPSTDPGFYVWLVRAQADVFLNDPLVRCLTNRFCSIPL